MSDLDAAIRGLRGFRAGLVADLASATWFMCDQPRGHDGPHSATVDGRGVAT